VPTSVIDFVIVTAPKVPGSSASISPPAAVFEIAPAKVLHGAVRLHGLASSPTPETQVRVACARAVDAAPRMANARATASLLVRTGEPPAAGGGGRRFPRCDFRSIASNIVPSSPSLPGGHDRGMGSALRHAAADTGRRRALIVLGWVALLARGATAAAAAPPPASVTTDQVAEDASLRPGGAAALGLRFDLAPHWHVYWRNPGDSGEPPRVAWTLPPGFTAGPLEWPAPVRIRVGPLANYGYEGSVLLPVRLAVPDAAAATEAAIAADVTWLVCRAEECIPGEARLGRALPVSADPPAPDPRHAAGFAAARRAMPAESRPATLATLDDGGLALRVPGLAGAAGETVTFFPFDAGVLENAAAQPATAVGDALELRLAPSAAATTRPAALAGVLTVAGPGGVRAYRLSAAAPAGSLWLALALAFAGGVLLNLMPCVFPVLSLKVLSFVRQADEAPGQVRAHGWVFTLGVLASFWVLAGALLALRAGGEQLGWGFQLQSPAVVAGLAALMVLLALALAGVFEIGLALTGVGQRAQRASGLAGSFWTGALATVVATPCTAPFMGVALGWALAQPPLPAMAVFTALGAGMAAPYLALAHVPAALRVLPRPGAWMAVLKGLLAFPLLATALWLVWVFHLQSGADAAFALLAALLVLSLAGWLWGRGQQRPRPVRWQAAAAVAVLAALPFAHAALDPEQRAGTAVAAEDPFWQPWSPDREAALRAAGKPVFVNYTAAWCLTCQVNERLVFAAPEVRDAFRARGVTPLRADWTDRSPAIASSLASHGRDGVPLYVFYPGGPGARAQVLPQLPTRETVIRALGATKEEETT
jgi:thiol:disulfide interchange protein